MSDDANERRAALVAEAERLKGERLADEQKAAVAGRAGRFSASEISEHNFKRSLRHLGQFTVAACLLLVGIMLSTATPEGGFPIGYPFFGVSAAWFVYFFTGVARFRRWERSLPFPLQSWDHVLGLNAAVTKAALEVRFKDTPAPVNVVAELVAARLGADTRVAHGLPLSLECSELDRSSTNWSTAQWARKAVNKVLLDVHAAYPVQSVQLKALNTAEFVESSGD
ncbi:MAG: hypothetical protein JNK82_31275 [Myxococcaceae bacterium]|nr:hypothetical protein [Myxococcaceae bacterium]